MPYLDWLRDGLRWRKEAVLSVMIDEPNHKMVYMWRMPANDDEVPGAG